MEQRRFRPFLGFTLIELLTVISIIGILVGLGGYVYGQALAKNRDAQRLQDLETLKSALERYRLDNRRYPPTVKSSSFYLPLRADWQLSANVGFSPCVKDDNRITLSPHYLTTIPKDPKTKEPVYNDCDSWADDVDGRYIYLSFPPAPDASVNEASKSRDYLIGLKTERHQSNFTQANFINKIDPNNNFFGGFYSSLGSGDIIQFPQTNSLFPITHTYAIIGQNN